MSTVDVFATPGWWVVTTASGARHLIDTSDPDAPVTVTRLTGADEAFEGLPRAILRRDGIPVRVSAVRYRDQNCRLVDGVALGEAMWLVMEPLHPDAAATVRRTTPVVSVRCVDEVNWAHGEGRDHG